MVYDITSMNLEDNYLLMPIRPILGLLYDVSVYGKEQKKFFFFKKAATLLSSTLILVRLFC